MLWLFCSSLFWAFQSGNLSCFWRMVVAYFLFYCKVFNQLCVLLWIRGFESSKTPFFFTRLGWFLLVVKDCWVVSWVLLLFFTVSDVEISCACLGLWIRSWVNSMWRWWRFGVKEERKQRNGVNLQRKLWAWNVFFWRLYCFFKLCVNSDAAWSHWLA